MEYNKQIEQNLVNILNIRFNRRHRIKDTVIFCLNFSSHRVFVLHPSGLSQEQTLSPTGNDREHQQEMAPIGLSLARRVPQSHCSH